MFNHRQFLASLTEHPGVYQMFDANHHFLYIGKARNLKKRVSSYFQKTQTQTRLALLVSQIHHIEVIVTRNENEALLLENQLIKEHMPRYNILLRDDKSYPFIVLSSHQYPRLFSKRGERHASKDHYFGPYPSSNAVRETVDLLQKVFKLRTCQDGFFRNRIRPCLLYQIKRCSAPCVEYISEEDYSKDINNAELFLSGKSHEVIKLLVQRMEKVAAKEEYEEAAKLRDQIVSLRHIQTTQAVTTSHGSCDVFNVVSTKGTCAVQALYIRSGRLLGNQTYYPRLPDHPKPQEILAAFLPQYYLTHEIPDEIVLSEKLDDQDWILNALIELRGKKLKMISKPKSIRAQWLALAEKTGLQAISTHVASSSHYQARLQALKELLNLPELPKRMECFDISHSFGEATVASCVVFNQEGPQKNAYRKFNIKDITKSDDYAAMYQAIFRRYVKMIENKENCPDVLFIDGGKGQLHQAENVLEEFNINNVMLVAIAKGKSRKPGLEQLYVPGKEEPLDINTDSSALHLIQHIRDEAHRFAIAGHRAKRAKTRKVSSLENIPGVGSQKRRALLRFLGGLQEIKKASVEELQNVPGISKKLAEEIYHALRFS